MSAAQIQADFEEWWREVGSALAPLPHEDTEEHMKRVAFRAWFAAEDEYND